MDICLDIRDDCRILDTERGVLMGIKNKIMKMMFTGKIEKYAEALIKERCPGCQKMIIECQCKDADKPKNYVKAMKHMMTK